MYWRCVRCGKAEEEEGSGCSSSDVDTDRTAQKVTDSLCNLISFTALIPRSGCVFNSFGPRILLIAIEMFVAFQLRLPRSGAFALIGRRKEAPSEITAPNNSIS